MTWKQHLAVGLGVSCLGVIPVGVALLVTRPPARPAFAVSERLTKLEQFDGDHCGSFSVTFRHGVTLDQIAETARSMVKWLRWAEKCSAERRS